MLKLLSTLLAVAGLSASEANCSDTDFATSISGHVIICTAADMCDALHWDHS